MSPIILSVCVCVCVCLGQSGLGKSTLMNTLFKSKVSRKSVMGTGEERIPKTIEIKSVSHGKPSQRQEHQLDTSMEHSADRRAVQREKRGVILSFPASSQT